MENLTSEISKYTEAIWQNILGLEVQPQSGSVVPDALDNTLASCVHIMGEWQGTVTLHCPASLARRVASIMFSLKEEETQISEIQDALGELANMTGGNLKSLFPEPCYLSLPTVAVTNFDIRVPGTQLAALVSFKCENKSFTVSILEKNGAK